MNPKRLFVLCLLALAACDDGQSPNGNAGVEYGVVVNSEDRSLSIFPADSPQSVRAIGLGPDGSPVTLAVRGRFAVAPLGIFPAAAVVDLAQGRVVHTVALPANSGATGVAFVYDSIALVANSNLNSVTPINVLRGTSLAAVDVGVFPQAIVALGDTAYVLNAELGPDFNPARNGRVSVITGRPLAVVRTIELTGTNPISATRGRDGMLYVLNAGSFGLENGSVSVVDTRTLMEVRRETGFGEFPGAIAAAADGRLFIAAFGYGVAVWDPVARTFVRAPANALQPGGVAGAAGVGADAAGRVYSLKPDCTNPSRVYRIGTTLAVESEVAVGICPIAISFTRFAGN